MKVSGFSFARNTSKLFYPIRESILSILPIVDEFVIALGKSDPDDITGDLIRSIKSDKIKIIHTEWDTEKFPVGGAIYAQQTDMAKAACTGDWLFYLQSDEVVHEKYLPAIRNAMEHNLGNTGIDGLLLRYLHFYGDYDHINDFHGWYDKEIRIIRNDPEIHSFMDAQSFRRIPDFDGESYTSKEGTYKLKVREIDASIYHYGWVRPPDFMFKKHFAFHSVQKGEETARMIYDKQASGLFDYGSLYPLRIFNGTHPAVMQEKVKEFDWGHMLHYEKGYKSKHLRQKHEMLKNRLLTRIERAFFNGRHIFDYTNWIKV